MRQANKSTRIDAQFEVIKILAEKGPMNMWQIKEQRTLYYSTVHKAVSTLANEGLIQPVRSVTSEKNVQTWLFGLTFKGFVTYLAKLDLNSPLVVGERGKPMKQLRKDRRFNEKMLFSKKRSHVKEIVERCGKQLDYPLFKECRILEKHFGQSIYRHFLKAAKHIYAYPPFPSGVAQILKTMEKQKTELLRTKKALSTLTQNDSASKYIVTFIEDNGKKTKSTEYDPLKEIDEDIRENESELRILLKKEDEWWRRGFAECFFERIAYVEIKGKIQNESLLKLAEELRKKKELELDVLERAVSLFAVKTN
ncbi:hypothetical protein MUP01_12360 [Candidatus Bathyarchaeota archaeon]|nr:hypothetical protein [Candidatus Bathyarchaeota archaeon]